jgi:hypothetical protein
MGKVTGWERALLAEIDAWSGQPFVWGSRDCLSLCIACARAVAGAAIFDDLPAYKTEKGAARGLKRLGYASVADLVADRLPEIPVAAAGRGDWVMRAAPSLAPGAFGVVLGRRAAFMAEAGLVMLPTLSAERAWRIA